MMYEIVKRILIVDDDIDFLMLLERRLLKEGFIVESAASLAEAEDIFPQYRPHLVLLDINLKGEDGRKLCYTAKNVDPNVKVIILSGYDHNLSVARLFGADDLLPKPINFDYLLHQSKSLLAARA